MKLLKLSVDAETQAGGILDKFSINFCESSSPSMKVDPICFVGVNGSGKSQLLQVIAEIFRFLDQNFRTFNPSGIKSELNFELEYLILQGKKIKHVRIVQNSSSTNPEVFCIEKGIQVKISDIIEIERLLPKKIIAYTSGQNETLSVPFLDTYQEYSSHVTKLALKKDVEYQRVPDTRLVLMDYNSNISIFVANFLLRDSKKLAIFANTIKLKDLHSFRIVVQLGHQAGPKNGVKLTDELSGYLKKFKKCATCHDYISSSDTWVFDFLVNDETRKAFRRHFLTAFDLYSAFYKLELLNNLIIKEKHLTQIRKLRKEKGMVVPFPTVPEDDKIFRFQAVRLNHKNSKDPVDYISLSDGEHQFVHIFGTIMMVEQENVLFLLDEPESHFNPKWRIEFISNLLKSSVNKYQQYLISSHSPYILSDCPKENVFLFEKRNNKVFARNPDTETYGAAFDELLKDAFNIHPPVSKKSLKDVRQLQKSSDLQNLKKRAPDFGSSIEKFYLNQRIVELKGKKKQ